MAPRHNLVLCFDAFGTLIKPKQPIVKQYALVAEQCGLKNLDVSQLKASFAAAYKAESAAHPNYGKASDMGAERWWTNVITSTFLPLLSASQPLPPSLAPKLLHRFSSSEGYDLCEPEFGPLLAAVKSGSTGSPKKTIITGVITNSDDRIPSILSSLRLELGSFRFGSGLRPQQTLEEEKKVPNHLDFHCMSYDVGFAKPSRAIFDAAAGMARSVLRAQTEGGEEQQEQEDEQEWTKVYVGDEVRNDLLAAADAGWHSILVVGRGETVDGRGDGIPGDLAELEDCGGGDKRLEEVFPSGGKQEKKMTMMRAGSLKTVLEWFGRY